MSGALVAQAINESIGTAGFQGLDAILKEYLGLIAEQAGTARVPISRTINGHSLASDVNLTNNDVGAAPSGFGLGTGAVLTSMGEIDTLLVTGWYYASSSAGYYIGSVPIYYILLRVDSWKDTAGSRVVKQTLFNDGREITRYWREGTWGEWEWVNPPMVVGVEYRTTERFLGQPVYTMLRRIGGFTGNGTCTFGESGYHDAVRIFATASYGGERLKVDDSKIKTIQHSAGYVYVQVSMDSETCTDCYVQMWYTK